jgi:phospholipid transport system transporter-binding protein
VSENGIARRADGTVQVTGPLTFQSVPEHLEQSRPLFTGGSDSLTFDLQGVTLADSAGLALLLEWREMAHASGRALTFVNLSDQMRHLIEVSGLSPVFASRA